MNKVVSSALALLLIVGLEHCVRGRIVAPPPSIERCRDATEPAPVTAATSPGSATIEPAIPAGMRIVAIQYHRSNPARDAAPEALSALIENEEVAQCLHGVRVGQRWLTHVVDLDGSRRGYPSECMRAQRIEARWVFFDDQIGGYETTSGTQVDTSWFQAWSVVDGAFERVYPTSELRYRKLPAGEPLPEANVYEFNRERVGLTWDVDGRSLVDLLEALPSRSRDRRAVSKRER